MVGVRGFCIWDLLNLFSFLGMKGPPYVVGSGTEMFHNWSFGCWRPSDGVKGEDLLRGHVSFLDTHSDRFTYFGRNKELGSGLRPFYFFGTDKGARPVGHTGGWLV